MDRNQAHIEMGPMDKDLVIDLEDVCLVSHGPSSDRRTQYATAAQYRYNLVTLCSEDLSWRHVWNIVLSRTKVVFFTHVLNVLVPCGPLAVLVDLLTGHQGSVFLLSLLGTIPLAERLGWVTEQLAFFTGPTVGGLLSATFGNATELIISIYAMRSGMIRVVQQSLLGSILSNMLLVLGSAFFGGGIVHRNKEQVFNKSNAAMDSGLLLMAVMGILFPAVLHVTHTELQIGKSELALSRFSSCVMLVAYGAYIVFQLKGQRNINIPVSEEDGQNDESSEDEETPPISKWESIVWLFILTAWISYLSKYLVNAIEGASFALDIPVAFISVILLPIVGNAAEHASAIMFAMKDKLDISLGVAIGSATQISMFGIPFCVVIGWIEGHPMDLNFQLFETATLFMTVLVVTFMLQDGTSNYFKGLMLLLCYLIVAASFFVHRDLGPIRDLGGGAAAAGLLSHGSGVTFYLCMIVLSVSIISMVIFNCGDSGGNSKRRHGGGVGGGSACGGGGGGGGCGGGGGGGGC